jgi:hypothetical protein
MSIFYRYECSIYFEENHFIIKEETNNRIHIFRTKRSSNVINDLFIYLFFQKAMLVYLCIPNFYNQFFNDQTVDTRQQSFTQSYVTNMMFLFLYSITISY